MARRECAPPRSFVPRVSSILTTPLIVLVLLALVAAACAAGEAIMEPTGPSEEEAEEPSAEETEPTLAPDLTAPPSTATAAPLDPTPIPAPTVEERIAELEWPSSMRVGDGEVVRLTLVVSPEEAYLTTPEITGHQVETATIPLPMKRAGYDGYVSASLATAGMETSLTGPHRQPLLPGRANTWRWTISAPQAGTYHLVVNLSVSWEPQSGTDARGPIEEAVWSRVLTIKARAPLGLSGPQTDWLGLGGTVLGTVAGLPFIEKALSTLWKRFRRRHTGAFGRD